MSVALPKPAQPGEYAVTAIIQDNREQTHKVCTVVEDSFKACDAVVETICIEQGLSLEVVKETWSLLYLSTIYIGD